jgi:Uma2 family endonuclease
MATNGPAALTMPLASAPPSAIPPLQNGDRLTAEEFWRRYCATPSWIKAELIEGVVYMTSPVIHETHGGPHFNLIGWLFLYRIATPGVEGGDNSTLRLDKKSVPQPYAFMMISPGFGGQANIDEDGYVTAGPELVAEVSATSASIDLGDKLVGYRRNGVREYIVWRVFDRAIDWFVLRGDQYEPLALDQAGVYRSEVFPGLWLDPAAMAAGNVVTMARVVQQGTTTAEHAAFVARLQQQSAAVKK